MPLRIAAPQSPWRGRHIAATLVVGAAALVAVQHFMNAAPHRQEVEARPAIAAPAQTSAPESHARWTIVYERPQACDETCAHVMETLNAVSHDPASGIPDGAAQVVVRTVERPARDLIVLDPEGQPAGFISHTTDPGRISSGLSSLRAQTATPPLASR